MRKEFYWVALGILLASIAIGLQQVSVQRTLEGQLGYYIDVREGSTEGIITPYGAVINFLTHPYGAKISDAMYGLDSTNITKWRSLNKVSIIEKAGFYLITSERDVNLMFRIEKVGFDNWNVIIIMTWLTGVIIAYGLFRRKMV